MKNRFFYIIICLTLLLGIIFLACKDDEKIVPQNPGVDLVNGITSVDDRLHFRSADLAAMPAVQRAAAIQQSRPFLSQGVVHFLRDKNRLGQNTKIDSVQFLFGSSKEIYGEDKTGKRHRGYFKDQLVAKIYPQGQAPQYVLVECLNGIYSLPEDFEKNLQTLGSQRFQDEFTIRRGEGLIHHVDYATAIDLSRRFGLKLYDFPLGTNKKMRKNREITADRAEGMENMTDWRQVTVKVFTGDKFNLRAMTYTPAPQPKAIKNKTKKERHKRRR